MLDGTETVAAECRPVPVRAGTRPARRSGRDPVTGVPAAPSVGSAMTAPIGSAGVLPVLPVLDMATTLAVAAGLVRAGLSTVLVTATGAAINAILPAVRQQLPALRLVCPRLALTDAEPNVADIWLVEGIELPSHAGTLQASALPVLRSPSAVRRATQTAPTQVAIAPTDIERGLAWLKLLRAQTPRTRVWVIGDVQRQDTALYLQHAQVAAVSAPWLIAPELIRRGDWSRLEAQARLAASLRPHTAARAAPRHSEAWFSGRRAS